MAHRYFIAWCLSVLCATAVFAEDIVVVVNKNNSVDKLSRDQVIDIFMGRNRQFSTGVTALPLDLPDDMPERENFYSRLTGKSVSEINAYWARLHFTGRAHPPSLMHNHEEVIQRIINNPGAVGYVNRSNANSKVKVVFELNEKK